MHIKFESAFRANFYLNHKAIQIFSNATFVNMLLDTTPCGLVDCHSHIVFGGNRARAFELRLTGPRYEEVACSGGGIDLTVTATRVVAQALGLDDVGTIETKNGRNGKREKRKTG